MAYQKIQRFYTNAVSNLGTLDSDIGVFKNVVGFELNLSVHYCCILTIVFFLPFRVRLSQVHNRN